jgi:hypothetical protein
MADALVFALAFMAAPVLGLLLVRGIVWLVGGRWPG